MTVLGSNALVRWLNRRKGAVDPVALSQIADAAQRHGTWTKSPDAPVDETHMATFAALREEVDQARVRRLAWTVVGMVLFVVGVFQLVPGWVATALGS